MYEVEKDWVTAAGLRAVIIKLDGSKYIRHRCGYVAVTPGHPGFGKHYGDQLPEITQEQAANTPYNATNPILLITAGVGADDSNSVRRSIDIVVSVHGGVTYAGGSTDYPVDTEEGTVWWFGFDTGHYGDDSANGGQPLDYVEIECESMAKQLEAIKPLGLPAP